MDNSYNLLDENWIPVLYRNGQYTRIGIRQAFTDAPRIRQIAAIKIFSSRHRKVG